MDRGWMADREPLPGHAPLRLLQTGARLLRPDEQVWAEMLEGWRASLLARNSAISTIRNYLRVLTDFRSGVGGVFVDGSAGGMASVVTVDSQ
jgi:hypothetical protein